MESLQASLIRYLILNSLLENYNMRRPPDDAYSKYINIKEKDEQQQKPEVACR